MRGRHRHRLVNGQSSRQRDRQARVAGDERAPTAVAAQTPNMIAHLVVSHAWSDRGHDSGEIGTPLLFSALECLVAAERDQHVGEVDVGGADRDLNLPRSRRNPFAGNRFHRLQITGSTDLQTRSPRRSSHWNGSLNRSELEVQFLEAPEQKGAVPFESTIACRTVLGL